MQEIIFHLKQSLIKPICFIFYLMLPLTCSSLESHARNVTDVKLTAYTPFQNVYKPKKPLKEFKPYKPFKDIYKPKYDLFKASDRLGIIVGHNFIVSEIALNVQEHLAELENNESIQEEFQEKQPIFRIQCGLFLERKWSNIWGIQTGLYFSKKTLFFEPKYNDTSIDVIEYIMDYLSVPLCIVMDPTSVNSQYIDGVLKINIQLGLKLNFLLRGLKQIIIEEENNKLNNELVQKKIEKEESFKQEIRFFHLSSTLGIEFALGFGLLLGGNIEYPLSGMLKTPKVEEATKTNRYGVSEVYQKKTYYKNLVIFCYLGYDFGKPSQKMRGFI